MVSLDEISSQFILKRGEKLSVSNYCETVTYYNNIVHSGLRNFFFFKILEKKFFVKSIFTFVNLYYFSCEINQFHENEMILPPNLFFSEHYAHI